MGFSSQQYLWAVSSCISTFCISLWLAGILRLTSSYSFKRRQQQERFSCKASATYVSQPEVPPALPDLRLRLNLLRACFTFSCTKVTACLTSICKVWKPKISHADELWYANEEHIGILIRYLFLHHPRSVPSVRGINFSQLSDPSGFFTSK